MSRVDGLVGRRGESALIDSFLEKSAAAGGALLLTGEPGLGFAVGCPLSYGPALRCASCRTSYELSLALVVALRRGTPTVASLPRAGSLR